MNTTECLKLLAVIAATYPNSGAAKASDDTLKMTAQAWSAALDDIPYKLASNALVGLIKTSKFAPTPSDIRSACSLVSGEISTRTADDMANLFFKARSYGIHNWKRIFKQKGIDITETEERFLEQQLQLAQQEDISRSASGSSENADVVRGQVSRAWGQRTERQKTEQAYLPIVHKLGIDKQLGNVVQSMRLTKGDN